MGLIKGICIYLFVWFVVLAAFAAQYRLGIDIPWSRAITRVLLGWSPWVFLAPIVWLLANRLPLFESSHRIRNLFLHLFFCAALVLVAELTVVYAVGPVTRVIFPPDTNPEAGRPRGPGLQRRRPPFHEDQVFELRGDLLARKAQFWIPLYWVLVFFTSSSRHYREAQEREKKSLQLQRDLATSQLQSIQSRLEPHFLFNTLNSISTLVYSDPDRADEMIGRLSDLLRRVLARSEVQQIALREELDLLRDYLAIQKIRFSDRLEVEEFIDEDTLTCLVPTLLLQPLAENAVKHGIEPKAEPSVLLLSSQRMESGEVELVVEDDGVGWEQSNESDGESGGFGLSAIRSRLNALYGESAHFKISTPETGGTRVRIILPYEANLS